jgi:two-component system, NarL family, sensor histidine kinase DevS
VDQVEADAKLRSLVEAGIALTSEGSLDALLRRLLELAVQLTGARYAALGVIAPGGAGLERFLTHGVDPETQAAIGAAPQGRGILGALVREAKPLRLHDLTDDPRSVGVPPNHPEMHTFLGVPILLRSVAYGNLYLTEKAGGEDFTPEDEELVALLAAQAAVAIENVRLFEAATEWSARLESLNEVGNALATETDLDTLLDLIARRLREMLGARFVSVFLPSGTGELRFAAVAGEGGEGLVGTTIGLTGSKSGQVLAKRRSERLDSVIDDPEVDQVVTRRLGASTGLWVPLVAHGEAIGVLAAHDKIAAPDGRFSDDDLRLAETFASRAAVAVDLSERVARDALRRVVAAQELERRRLARELHDETGQALASILLGLRGLERLPDPAQAHEALVTLRELAVATLRDVRRLAVDLRPKALDDFGLASALERLVETWGAQTGISVDFAARLDDRQISDDAATAVYRIVQEALTNVVKHAEARHVSILLTRKNERVVAVIEDDGHGFDPAEGGGEGSGIQSMRERVQLVDGLLTIESGSGAGTTLVAEVPGA